MDKCKFCEAELEENSTVCPSCGKDNAPEAVEEVPAEAAEIPEEAVAEPVQEEDAAQPQQETAPVQENKANPKLIAAVIVLSILVVVLAFIVFSGRSKPQDAPSAAAPVETIPEAPAQTEETVPPTVPADGNPDDVTCKGTYTSEDAAANRDVVVARAGDKELTISQLNVFYWMEVRNFLTNYGAYAAYFGLDFSQDLDTQMCAISQEPRTWQQFFLENALNSWLDYQSLAAEAEQNGVVLEAEEQNVVDTIEADLEASAKQNGFANADELLQKTLGKAVTMADYRHFTELYYNGMHYFNAEMDKIQPTEEELEHYFLTHEGAYGDEGITKDTCTIDVRHILIMPKAAEGAEATEADWAAAEQRAQELLQQWKDGDHTEDSFAEMAGEYTEDPGSMANGGLYANVEEGQMVPEFNDWCFDPNRQYGDTDIVKTTYGYHIMFFVGSKTVWQEHAKTDYLNDKSMELLESVSAKYPLTVDYSAIKLAYVNLGE